MNVAKDDAVRCEDTGGSFILEAGGRYRVHDVRAGTVLLHPVSRLNGRTFPNWYPMYLFTKVESCKT